MIGVSIAVDCAECGVHGTIESIASTAPGFVEAEKRAWLLEGGCRHERERLDREAEIWAAEEKRKLMDKLAGQVGRR